MNKDLFKTIHIIDYAERSIKNGWTQVATREDIVQHYKRDSL